MRENTVEPERSEKIKHTLNAYCVCMAAVVTRTRVYIVMSVYLTSNFRRMILRGGGRMRGLRGSIFIVTFITYTDFQFTLVLFFARHLYGGEFRRYINVEDTLMLSAIVSC